MAPHFGWRRAGSEQSEIFRSMALLTVFVGLGGLAKLGREAALAWRLGVSQLTDAYSFLLTISTWMVSLWFSVAMVILLPVITRARMDGEDSQFQMFRRELGGLTISSALLAASLVYIGIWLFADNGSGFNEPTISLIFGMLPGMSASVFLGILVGLHSVWMLAMGRHANTLFEAIPPLVFTCAVLVASVANSVVLVAATVVGVAVQLAVMARVSGYGSAWPLFSLRAVYWRGMGYGLLAMVLGQAVMGLTTLVDQAYVSHLDEGSTTVLNYATRYQVLVLAVIAVVVTRATLPVFSRVSTVDEARSARMALAWAGVIFMVAAVGTAVIWWLFPLLVSTLMGHGNFSAANEAAVVEVARVGVWQTPFYASAMALTSFVASIRRYHLLLVSGILALVVKLAGNYFLSERYGIRGLAAATVLVYAVNCMYFVVIAIRYRRSARSNTHGR